MVEKPTEGLLSDSLLPGAAIRRMPGSVAPSVDHEAPTLAAGIGARERALESDFSQIPARVRALPPKHGQAPDGSPAGGAAGGTGAKTPTLSLSGVDSYSDNSESHETITYTVNVPTGIDVKKYCLVQWTKGYAKQGDGTYFKTTVYGTTRDWNDATWVIDSVDKDPIYWSSSSGRWNYNKSGNTFTATDDPGPALSSETEATYAAQFKVAVYETDKVPTTTTGTIATSPVTGFQYWNYSVKVDKHGKFSHSKL